MFDLLLHTRPSFLSSRGLMRNAEGETGDGSSGEAGMVADTPSLSRTQPDTDTLQQQEQQKQQAEAKDDGQQHDEPSTKS